jgi:menaquinone-dependent protoporphyrinogen IX oxidase
VLIVLGGRHRHLAGIADVLSDDLTRDGFLVECAVLQAAPPPPLADYDAVVIVTPVLLGSHSKTIADYIRAHESELTAVPAFLVAVGGPGLSSSAGYVERMTRRTGWHPAATVAFDTSELSRGQLLDLAQRIADEIPPVLQPSVH